MAGGHPLVKGKAKGERGGPSTANAGLGADRCGERLADEALALVRAIDPSQKRACELPSLATPEDTKTGKGST